MEPRDVTVIAGGRVFTASNTKPWAEALAIVGSRIVGVGSLDEVVGSFPGARMLDVEGRTVLPGLIDAHNHFLATGESLASVDARYPGTASIEELVRTLGDVARGTPTGTWVTAFGFDDAKYERVLTRWDLDRASTQHPIRVHHISGHHVVDDKAVLHHRRKVLPRPVHCHLRRLKPRCREAAEHLPRFHTEDLYGGS